MPAPVGAPRAEVIRLLAEGHSDHYVMRVLRVGNRRVARIRREVGIPSIHGRPRSPLTVEQAWATFTRPVEGGHLLWTGPLREGVPSFQHHRRAVSARRVAFSLAHTREPVGRVKSGCGRADCVAPAHVEDQQIRDTYKAVFGGAA